MKDEEVKETEQEVEEKTTESAKEDTSKKKNKKKEEKDEPFDLHKELVEDAKLIIQAVITALIIVIFIAQPVRVRGDSMNDTLHDGEKLFMEKVSRYYGGLKRFDIVVFDPENENDPDSLYVKRIIGLPGERVRIDEDGNIYINGEKLEGDVYGREVIEDPGMAEEEITLSDKEYFCMGDNRNESLDSRFKEVGPVNIKQIKGHPLFQMFPFKKIEK